MSVATVLLNNAIVAYGDKPLAAMGIVTKAYLFIVFIHMGIANGIQPLLGYCYGAGNRERFMRIVKFSGALTLICGTVLTAVYIGLRGPIVGMFIDDAEVVAYGERMLFATSLAGPILGLLFLSINSMQALDRPIPATMLSICRQGLLFIPLLYLLNAGFGLDGINFTQTVADYISVFLSLFLLMRTIRSMKQTN
ncbi:MAG: MATE family efflux transporter [Lachnospiraceae bacterium]